MPLAQWIESGYQMSFRIRLDDPRLLPELVDTLRRAECEARVVDDEVAVGVPRASSLAQAERELTIHVAVWRARYPDCRAAIVGREPA